jgi:hypothetical protein
VFLEEMSCRRYDKKNCKERKEHHSLSFTAFNAHAPYCNQWPIWLCHNITIDRVGKSKHIKTLLRYKESKDRQHVSAPFYKAIIRSDMAN